MIDASATKNKACRSNDSKVGKQDKVNEGADFSLFVFFKYSVFILVHEIDPKVNQMICTLVPCCMPI